MQNNLRERTNYCLNLVGPWKTSSQKLVDIDYDE